MTVTEFTDIFLPHLIRLWVNGELPLHGLVDIDTWRQVFPDRGSNPASQFHWYEIGLTSNMLNDQTMLFTFTLPQPLIKGAPKFAAIRLDPQARDARRATLYTLRKPASIYDQWDIHYVPFPNEQNKTEAKFRIKVNGTESLRNFILTAQQLPFIDGDYDTTWMTRIKNMLSGALSTQNDKI